MTPQEAYEIRRQATTVERLTATVAEVQAAWDTLGDTEALRYCPAGLGSATPAQLDALVAAAADLV